jgi:hypothetical protein
MNIALFRYPPPKATIVAGYIRRSGPSRPLVDRDPIMREVNEIVGDILEAALSEALADPAFFRDGGMVM